MCMYVCYRQKYRGPFLTHSVCHLLNAISMVRLTPWITLNCYKFEFSENFGGFRRNGRQQQHTNEDRPVWAFYSQSATGDSLYSSCHCESKKLGHFYFYCNFGECWSIFKILSMSESERNGS